MKLQATKVKVADINEEGSMAIRHADEPATSTQHQPRVDRFPDAAPVEGTDHQEVLSIFSITT